MCTMKKFMGKEKNYGVRSKENFEKLNVGTTYSASAIDCEIYLCLLIANNLRGYVNAWDELKELLGDCMKILIGMRSISEY